MSDGKFDNWLVRWNLAQDGEATMTGQSSSLLLPVLRDGARAILKIAVDEEELRGGDVMDWYAGDGAAKVLAHEGPALVLERLSGPRDRSFPRTWCRSSAVAGSLAKRAPQWAP